MTPFFVQIKCELGKSYQVANALAEAEIASEIYSTAGDYDLLVKFYVEAGTDIGHFVNEKVQVDSRHQGHPHHHHLQGVPGLTACRSSGRNATPSVLPTAPHRQGNLGALAAARAVRDRRHHRGRRRRWHWRSPPTGCRPTSACLVAHWRYASLIVTPLGFALSVYPHQPLLPELARLRHPAGDRRART